MSGGYVEHDFEFEFSPELMCYAQAVVWAFPEEFEHLVEADLGFLFTGMDIKMGGRSKTAYAMIPQAQGQGRKIFNWVLGEFFGRVPDALIVANKDDWQDLAQEQRIALMYHELLHLKQKDGVRGPMFDRDSGKPILEIQDHDVEEFYDVTKKFGNWHHGLTMLQTYAASDEDKVEAKVLVEIFDNATVLIDIYELSKAERHIGWIEQKALDYKQEAKRIKEKKNV